MLFYGKTAVGLGESLNLPATTKDLLENYPEETNEYLSKNEVSLKEFLASRDKRNSATARHEFLKEEHKAGRFLGEVTTADDLIDRFYSTFPNINSYLSECANKAVIELFIRTSDPIGRIRKFPAPENNGEESAIKRAAMNMPIQGASGNMTKYAICLIKKHIEDNDLQDKLKFALPIHDEIRCLCREDFAEEGLKVVVDKMEEAAEFILGNKLLKADGGISLCWEK